MIYNPWFEAQGVDAVVVPMGVRAEDYAAVFPQLFRMTTLHGALVTMPHKVVTTGLVDELTVTARIAGACNAVLKRADGTLVGDMFDGAGFVRGMERKGRALRGCFGRWWWGRAAWARRSRRRSRRGGWRRSGCSTCMARPLRRWPGGCGRITRRWWCGPGPIDPGGV